MSELTDNVRTVAAELRVCAVSWERDVRLLGNVRAADIVRVCDEIERTAPIVDAARTVVERHRARPCPDTGKDCAICALAAVLDRGAP